MKTANEMSNVVMHSMVKRQFPIFLTNAAVGGLHECDVLGINRSNYIYEYEIKRSRADYLADFKKTFKHENLKHRYSHKIYKQWAKGKKTEESILHINIPNRFFYTCEPNLISVDEIPEYAGLVYIDDENEMIEVKPAPLLHRIKPDDHMFRAIASILSQRQFFGCSYMTYRNKLIQEKNNKLINNE